MYGAKSTKYDKGRVIFANEHKISVQNKLELLTYDMNKD